ncbi:carboxylic ester hydrolase [Aureococcus anophagefferens]|nr:carboxylic ester hydrolase [Aureococcus anophagefferens]
MAATHGTLDVVVHFHRFRNVDLFSRGIYMIRVSTQTKSSRQIVNETSEFSTRAFVIKYRDERLELNEGVQFQLLIESRVEEAKDGSGRLVFENDEPITVKLDLLMAELEKPSEEQPNLKYRGNTVAAEKPSSSPTFTRIASQTMCVVGDAASQQLHAYFPATFSAMHFCQLDVTVHTALINLKFRKRAYSRTDGDAKGARRRRRGRRDPPMLQSLGATAAALRNMCADEQALEAAGSAVPSSRAVAGVMALIKKPYLEGSPFNGVKLSSAPESGELTPLRLAASIETDIKLVARRLFLLWGRFVALLPQEPRGESGRANVAARLQRTWLASQRRWWGSRLKNSEVRIQKLLQPREPAELDGAFRELRAASRPGGPRAMLSVFDGAMLADPSLLPVAASHVFLRRGQKFATSPQPVGGIPEFEDQDDDYRGPHLIVMQHGWYASSLDMRLLRAYALLLFPRAIVLSPQSNEDNSGGSMGPMGQRLAHEVHNFIKHRCDELSDPDPKMGRLSFIGHSAGSMIVRTALTSPIFRPYLSKLHTFVSLSSSHCGNMFVPSTIISGGMWALQHLHQSTFMDELQLIDRDTMNESFMYKLSQAKGFEYFKYVVLVGSTQDSYVPMHTAQATIPRPAEADKKGGGDAYMQMATNLMSPISQKTAESDKQTTVVRLTMEYKFTQTNLDTVIGRAAHLAYIDSSAAVLLILFSLYNLLK